MEKYYTDQGICNHERAVLREAYSDIKGLKAKLTSGSVQFGDIFDLSIF